MMSRGPDYHKKRIKLDLIIIALSVVAAIFFKKAGFFTSVMEIDTGFSALNSFLAGILFTSIFTTPISIAAFLELAKNADIFTMAFFGAFGAVAGDLILFIFVKDRLAVDIEHVLKEKKFRKFFMVFRQRLFRWITPLIGALVIASPFPDELGIAMMGLSGTLLKVFIPVSFVMNFVGIYLVGLFSGIL